MKIFVTLLLVAAAAYALPTPDENIIMTFADDGKTPIYEDLNKQVITTYGVDTNKLHFMLYTRENRDSPQELKTNDGNVLKNSNFNPSAATKFIIHGWQNTYKAESVQLVKDAYLQSGELNVIAFDYEAYNAPYLTAVSNAESIGSSLATFINFLTSQGLSINNVHIAGHSLGAHIAGYTANKVSGTIPRITGLDPAGPLFSDSKSSERLSSDDAKIVDVIHTSTSLGMGKAIGTSDFYPHGGSAQPSCAGNIMADGCDHSASYRYFAETINNRQRFPARACNTEKEAQIADPAKNPCSKSAYLMGEDGQNASGSFFYVEV